MTTPARSYGLHTDEDGVTFLHQGNESMNFIGLGRPSPFKVQAGNTPLSWLVGKMQKVCMRRMISIRCCGIFAPGWGTPGFYYIEAEGHDLDGWVALMLRYLEVSTPPSRCCTRCSTCRSESCLTGTASLTVLARHQSCDW